MARRKAPPSHENHERWLVSYADFITLLFAFFVVMFASSQTDRDKAKRVSESIKRALEDDQFSSALAGILGGAVGLKDRGNVQMKGPGGQNKVTPDPAVPETGRHMAELVPSLEVLEEKLRHEIESGMLQVHMEARGLVVSLREAAFFAPGDSTVNTASYETLEKVAKVMATLPNKVRLEGHTDSIPINNVRFGSNWELSSSRGLAMLHMLHNQYGIPTDRLSVGGYADTVPVDTNDTPEGRARNRRVDIVILNEFGLRAEPGEATPPKAAGGAPSPAPPPAPAAPAVQNTAPPSATHPALSTGSMMSK